MEKTREDGNRSHIEPKKGKKNGELPAFGTKKRARSQIQDKT